MLVEQQQARAGDGRHQQGDGLALSAGQRADPCVEPLFEAKPDRGEARRGIPPVRAAVTARRRPRACPRRAAIARFSAIDIEAQVLSSGSCAMRPISAARRCTGAARDVLAVQLDPAGIRHTSPAIALSRVDLPAPFDPMTVTKSPAASVRLIAIERAHLVRRAGA